MTYLIMGLVLFLGVHSVRIVADDWRTRTRSRLGEGAFKGLYSVLSLAGLALVIWGFSMARETPVMLWLPPRGMRHAASLLTLVAFVLLAAAYVPGNTLKARVHHPMALGVQAWALAHLASNGSVAHVVLFGSFGVWAVLSYLAARQRDRVQGLAYAAGSRGNTVLAVLLGVGAWALFAVVLHGLLIGVRPFG